MTGFPLLNWVYILDGKFQTGIHKVLNQFQTLEESETFAAISIF